MQHDLLNVDDVRRRSQICSIFVILITILKQMTGATVFLNSLSSL